MDYDNQFKCRMLHHSPFEPQFKYQITNFTRNDRKIAPLGKPDGVSRPHPILGRRIGIRRPQAFNIWFASEENFARDEALNPRVLLPPAAG